MDEPIYMIDINWDSKLLVRYTSTQDELVDFSGVTSQSNDNMLGSIESAEVTISSDSMKLIFDTYAIEGSPVDVYMNGDLILAGKATAPIQWNENERSLSMGIISRVEGELISAYDEEIQNNDDIIYEEPPFCFGSVAGVPGANTEIRYDLVLMTEIYQRAVSTTTVHSLTHFKVRNGHYLESLGNTTLYIDDTLFFGFFEGNTFKCDGGFNIGYASGQSVNSRPSSHEYYMEPNVIWTSNNSGDYHGRYIRITWTERQWVDDEGNKVHPDFDGATYETFQRAHATRVSMQDGTICYLETPPTNIFGEPILLGSEATIAAVCGKMDLTWRKDIPDGYPSSWVINAGTKVKVYTGSGESYYGNWLPSEAVHGVYSFYQNKLITVPSSFYSVELTPHTVINMHRYLSRYGWDDDRVYVSLTSSVGPNVVDVIQWIIENYTNMTVDAASFATVKALPSVANYPVGFALLESRDSIDVLKTILWEAHLSMTIVNGVAYLADQSVEPTATSYTLAPTNTEFGSIKLSTTDSMDLYSIFKMTWRPTYFPTDYDHRIYRTNNKEMIGNRDFNYAFTIYNRFSCAKASTEFWVMRYSNIWQYIEASVFLTGVALNAYDAIGISLSYVSALKGIIQNKSFNPTEDATDLKVMMPLCNSGAESPWMVLNDPMPEGMFDEEQIDFTIGEFPYFWSSRRRRPRKPLNEESEPKDVNVAEMSKAITKAFVITGIAKNHVTAVEVDQVDYITPVDQVADDNVDETIPEEVQIALPLDFRCEYYDEEEIISNGVVYNYVLDEEYDDGIQKRHVTTSEGDDYIETLEPAYKVGDVIEAQYMPGGTGINTGEDGFIVWQDMNRGTRRWYSGRGAGEPYSGPFKLIYDTEMQQIKIVDGDNPLSTGAGVCLINGERVAVASGYLDDPITADVTVYLTANIDAMTGGFVTDFAITTSNYQDAYPLGKVKYVEPEGSGEPYYTINQYRHSRPVLMITAPCVPTEE